MEIDWTVAAVWAISLTNFEHFLIYKKYKNLANSVKNADAWEKTLFFFSKSIRFKLYAYICFMKWLNCVTENIILPLSYKASVCHAAT